MGLHLAFRVVEVGFATLAEGFVGFAAGIVVVLVLAMLVVVGYMRWFGNSLGFLSCRNAAEVRWDTGFARKAAGARCD